MKARVLLVDDDENILRACSRTLRRQFHIETALGGSQGLETIAEQEPFAVVVSDMRMPGMDGIQFLKRARDLSPDSVRVMLTGASDQKTATDAVNEGNIFRFLSKPCPPETMTAALEAAARQYQLVTAEKELLESTLKGSIQVLVEILSLANPVAFSRAKRLKSLVSKVCVEMGLPETWRFEVAALLSQIGFVTVPGEVLEKVASGADLTEGEQRMVAELPEVASNLIRPIPRLETVAEIIRMQGSPWSDDLVSDPAGNAPAIGGHVLAAATTFDSLLLGGTRPAHAIETMRRSRQPYHAGILDLLESAEPPTLQRVIMPMKIRELRPGMSLAEDVRTADGMLVVTKGQEVTEALRRRLANFRVQKSLAEPLRVYVLQALDPEEA